MILKRIKFKTKNRIGRGYGSKYGKTAGKGAKGQLCRSGVSLNDFEGGQTPFFKRIPKRGFNKKKNIVNINYTLQKKLIIKKKFLNY